MEKNLASQEKRNFVVRKRRIPLNHPYLKGSDVGKYKGLVNQQLFLYKHFETSFAVKAGEVYLVRFPFEFGSEIHGDHYVVVLLDSNELNPLVTVVPLKSDKGKVLNPASDIRIGEIEGLNNKSSIAVINQVRSIDKRRLISTMSIDALHKTFRQNELKDYEKTCVQIANVYRLTDEQFKLLKKTTIGYIISGYVSHDN